MGPDVAQILAVDRKASRPYVGKPFEHGAKDIRGCDGAPVRGLKKRIEQVSDTRLGGAEKTGMTDQGGAEAAQKTAAPLETSQRIVPRDLESLGKDALL